MASLDILINPRGAQSGAAAVRRALDDVKMAARSTVDAMESGFTRLKDRLFSVQGVLAALGVGLATREILEAIVKTDQMRITLEAVTGSAAGARAELAFVRETAKRLGLEVASTAGQYAQLIAATKGTAIAGQATRDIFLGVAEAATVLHLNAQQVEGAMVAIQQMASKGVVSMQELRIQLGNAIPGAFNIAARAMGVTTAELNDMMERGDLLATDLLPRLGAQLRKEFAGGIDEATTSTQASLNRLKNTVFDLQVSIGQSGFVAGLVRGIEALSRTLEDPRLLRAGGQFGAILGGIIEQTAALAQVYAPGMAEAFVDGFKRLILGGAQLLDFFSPVTSAITHELQAIWDRYVAITGAVPGLMELGLIGLFLMGTRGRAAVIGGLLLLEGAIALVKEGEIQLKQATSGKDPDQIRWEVEQIWAELLGSGAGAPKVSFELDANTGPAERKVKEFFAELARLAKSPKGPLQDTGAALTPGAAVAPIDDFIKKTLLQAEGEARLAEVKRELTQAYGSQSMELVQATKFQEVLNSLTRQGKTLTEEQTEALRGFTDRMVLATEQTSRLAEAEKRYHEQTKFRVDLFGTLDREIEQARLLQDLRTQGTRVQEVELEVLRAQQQAKLLGQALDAQELAALREKVTILNQLRNDPQDELREDRAFFLRARVAAGDASLAGPDEMARRRADLLKAEMARELRLTQGQVSQVLDLVRQGELERADIILTQSGLTEDRRKGIAIQAAAEIEREQRRATMGFVEAWREGLVQYINDTQSMWRLGVDLARQTAQAMNSSFQSLFFDLLQGRILTLKDALQGLLTFARQIGSQILGSLATQAVLQSFAGGLGGGGLFGLRHGGIMPVRRYAGGGVAHQPQLALFGEGSQSEAFVPLPDGQTIPVTLQFAGQPPSIGQTPVPQIINQISVEVINEHPSADVQPQASEGPDGRMLLRVLIRDTTKSLLNEGELDRELRLNFNLPRAGAPR